MCAENGEAPWIGTCASRFAKQVFLRPWKTLYGGDQPADEDVHRLQRRACSRLGVDLGERIVMTLLARRSARNTSQNFRLRFAGKRQAAPARSTPCGAALVNGKGG